MTPREARDRLWDIVEAAQQIQRHDAALAAIDAFRGAEELFKDAVHYQLVVIGEAVGALPEDVTTMDPEIPWRAISGLRNRLAHEYFRIDPEAIREVVRRDLPDLIERVSALAREL